MLARGRSQVTFESSQGVIQTASGQRQSRLATRSFDLGEGSARLLSMARDRVALASLAGNASPAALFLSTLIPVTPGDRVAGETSYPYLV